MDPARWQLLPGTLPPCVYVILGDFNSFPVYIGQTTNLRGRLQSHGIRYAWPSDRIEIPWFGPPQGAVRAKVKFPRRLGEHLMLEARLIYRLRPIGNKSGLGPVRREVLL